MMLTSFNAVLDTLDQDIADTESNLNEYREYIKQHPRAFGLTRVMEQRDHARQMLYNLRRKRARLMAKAE